MPRAKFFAVCALFLTSQALLPARSWEVLEECEYSEGAHSDGDSIEVRRRGKHHVFRLYFVDCLEKNPASRARRRAQARYFGLKGSEGAALRAAYLAKNFTKSKLSQPFTVYTRWQPVEVGGDNPAVRAFLKTADGEDLSRLLVREGLAIIRHGDTAISDHPNGTRRNEISSALKEAEMEAQRNKRGAWGLANSSKEVAAKDVLMATAREALVSRAGTRAKVRGRVSRIGELRSGRLTFINFQWQSPRRLCGNSWRGRPLTLFETIPAGTPQSVGRERRRARRRHYLVPRFPADRTTKPHATPYRVKQRRIEWPEQFRDEVNPKGTVLFASLCEEPA